MKYVINTYRSVLYLALILFVFNNAFSQPSGMQDTTIIFTPSNPNLIHPQNYRPLIHSWGLDILLSNNGFGIGGFYRYEMTDEFSLMLNLAISDVKDDAEVEQFDYYTGQDFIQGKKNRLLLIPLTLSLQYRLFKDDIVDNFRPFITAGLGPTMMFVAPYVFDQIHYDAYGYPYREKIDFFSSLKYGHLRYSLGGFIGAGVYFGMEKGSMTCLSVKYFLTRFPDGIEVMYDGYTKNFGGLFITLTFGSMF